MRNVNFKQFLFLILIFFFLFGDFLALKKKLKKTWKYINNSIFKKSNKKNI